MSPGIDLLCLCRSLGRVLRIRVGTRCSAAAGADVSEHRGFRVRHAGVDEPAVREPPCEVGDLGVVLLPLGNVLRTRELGLFLQNVTSISASSHGPPDGVLTVSGFWQRSIVFARSSLSLLPVILCKYMLVDWDMLKHTPGFALEGNRD